VTGGAVVSLTEPIVRPGTPAADPLWSDPPPGNGEQDEPWDDDPWELDK